MRESQSYYLLGFSASDANPDGTEHTIAVKVDRRGVKVQARRRFVQPVASHAPTTDDSTSPAAAALTGLLPDPALPLALHLGTFASPNGGLPTVTVALGINAFGPSAAAETTDTPLQVIVAALDPTGRPVASARQTVDLAWPRPDAGRRPDVEALTHLALPAGDYQIRVAVENQRTHEVSSVFDYVTVPSFASVPFSLSTIAIGAPTTTASVPPGALRDLLPVAPTTSRAFSRRADVPAFMRVYQGTERTDAIEPVSVRVRIMDDQDRALRDEALPLGADAFADGRTADCHLTLPVSQLPPGNYLLRVEASMGERLAGRAIRFSVTD
jgi:hypothetical protein